MSHLLYLMFRCDFNVMENLESLEEWEGSEHRRIRSFVSALKLQGVRRQKFRTGARNRQSRAHRLTAARAVAFRSLFLFFQISELGWSCQNRIYFPRSDDDDAIFRQSAGNDGLASASNMFWPP